MENIKITIEEINNKLQLIYRYSLKTKDNDKLNYIISRLEDKIQSVLKPINERHEMALNDVRMDNAAVEEVTKVLLSDEKGNFKYTSSGQKAASAKINELQKAHNQKEVELEVLFFDVMKEDNRDVERIKNLPLYTKEKLGGFLFKPFVVDESDFID